MLGPMRGNLGPLGMAAGKVVVIPWYLSGGIDPATCRAAYQPIGAANYAASLVNLAHPGTNDATEGTAPAWDAVNGWQFIKAFGTYLKTGLFPVTSPIGNRLWSIGVRFSGVSWAGGSSPLVGSGYFSYGLNLINDGGGGPASLNWCANGKYESAFVANGVMFLAGTRAYLNGLYLGDVNWAGYDPGLELYIGCGNAWAPDRHCNAYEQAVVVYDTVVPTDAQVIAVSTAMAAL